jgi:putative endonuclease
MFSVYILYSLYLDKYYIGYSEDVAKRLIQHNIGLSVYTSKSADWKIVYQEDFKTRELAMERERNIKKKKSRKYIEYLINSKI